MCIYLKKFQVNVQINTEKLLGPGKCIFVSHLKKCLFQWYLMTHENINGKERICSQNFTFHLRQEKFQSSYILGILAVLNKMAFCINSIEL